jgi:hypothetical protein
MISARQDQALSLIVDAREGARIELERYVAMLAGF